MNKKRHDQWGHTFEVLFLGMELMNRMIWWQSGAGNWVECDIGDAKEPKGLGTGAAVADVDGDGRLELLM